MKTYDEIITFMVNDAENIKRLRYSEWAAIYVIAEIYGKNYANVKEDIDAILKANEAARREQMKIQSKLDHEQRRLNNLAKKAQV